VTVTDWLGVTANSTVDGVTLWMMGTGGETTNPSGKLPLNPLALAGLVTATVYDPGVSEMLGQ
jgi:hypothetical protein